MIQFHCCECGREMEAADDHSGKTVFCPKCYAMMLVPGQPHSIAAAPAVGTAVHSGRLREISLLVGILAVVAGAIVYFGLNFLDTPSQAKGKGQVEIAQQNPDPVAPEQKPREKLKDEPASDGVQPSEPPLEKKSSPKKNQPDSPATKVLLSKVNAVSSDDINRYEKALDTNALFDWTLALGTLRGSCNDEVQKIKDEGSEKAAAKSLLQLLKTKKDSKDNIDHLKCYKAIDALDELGQLSDEEVSLLEQLRNHTSPAVKGRVASILKKTNPPPHPPNNGKLLGTDSEKDIRTQFRALFAELRGKGPGDPADNRLKKMQSIKDLQECLDVCSKELRAGPAISFRFLMNLKPVYVDNVFQRPALNKYLARAKAIPATAISSFAEAAVEAGWAPLDSYDVATLILVQLPIFEDERFQLALFQIALDEAKKAKVR